ncbi:amino acid adenylation domain-containing protein [Corallococcus sp. BB11-1]|uniref:non-ribosomal peptide synthetase n=1 Tax=Corallococcus sp. BB11-1 TaxID=2996783 RepID=UPI00226DF16E|nr:non-ribosomal peptide synthetase [Corallococcus sp. BB11-1]MCY1035334.1 amino acid adenylation domain-containing protein [Corallococcus sp. BB11-1]
MSIDVFRLSPQQQRSWRLQRRGGPLCVDGLMHLEGPLRRDDLQRALDRLVDRHEVLRTTFPTPPGSTEPAQAVNPRGEVAWDVLDLGAFAPEERERRAKEHFEQLRAHPFPLDSGPALRAMLATLDGGRHLLGLVLPAMRADAATLRLLFRELRRAYAAGPDAATSEPLPYLSFSEWQGELVAERADPASPAAAWWERHFRASPPVALPMEQRGGAVSSLAPERHAFTLRGEVVAALEGAARGAGCTVEALVLATWAALLGRLTGQGELVVGLWSDGREHPELAETFGPMARWLPLRCDLEPTGALDALARQVQQARAELLEWQRYFVWPVEGEEPVAGRDHPTFGFEWDTPAPGDVPVRAFVDPARVTLARESVASGALGLELRYDPGFFTGADLRHLAGQLEALLEQAASAPGTRLDALEPLGPRERERLLVDFNATERSLSPRCVHAWIAEAAAQHPARTAVVYEDASLTYAQLDARANQVAHALRKRGVGPESRVGLLLDRSLEIVVGMLGVMKAGAAYVPLDPSQPRLRLQSLLEDLQAPVLLTERRRLKDVPAREGCEVLCLDPGEAVWSDEPTHAPESDVTPEHPAYVLFTSGSTGRPKGVVVEHRQLHNYVASILERLELPRDATYATVSTFAADLGNTVIFPALCTGSCLHVISSDRASDPLGLADYLRRHPVDVLKVVPSHLRALLSAGDTQALLPKQRLILGGEASPRAWVEQLQQAAPHCRIHNHYGPTETTVGVMTFRFDPARPFAARTQLPLERPIDNTRVYVLDARMRPVPVGVSGELYVGGAALARGYLGRPELTAQAFIPDPFSVAPGARLYRTGDLGRHLSDGTLEHLGRADSQVKYHGYRVELSELRHALTQHPQVRDGVVLLKHDTNGNEVLVAYYVARQELEPEELRAFLAERLIDEVLPNLYIHLRKLPLTLNGKPHYDALPSIEQARQKQRKARVPPRTESEATLARIWSQVLNLEGVGVHDNFFGLGGDSILCIQVISKANQAGLRLTPRQLFQHQTIAELASVATEAPAVPAIVEAPLTGPLPLTPIQRWFFDQESPEPDAWCILVPLDARQPLDVARLQQALSALLDRHDALRLRAVRGPSGWEATVAPQGAPFPLERVDLSAEPDATVEAQVRQVEQRLQQGLHLSTGPVVAAAFLDFGARRPARVLIAAHRLVVDGVSWRILFEHLQSAYEQLLTQERCELPPRTRSLKAWVEALQRHATTGAREELAHWSTAGAPTGLLPVDRVEAALPLTLDQRVAFTLTPEESRALLHTLPERHHSEIGELLIAALAKTLCGWSGQPHLRLDLEGHGREDLFDGMDLSQTVGWFASLYPVQLTPSPGPDLGETVKAVKEQLRAVPHRGIGHGVLRYLGTGDDARALAAQPRAQVLFRYVGQYHLSSPWLTVLDAAEPQAPTRQHRLAVVAGLSEGQLRITWFFSEAMYQRSTMEALAERHAQVLRALIAGDAVSDAPAYTPSDFPLAGLDQRKLDKLLSRFKK